eukprot:CAMPEP_0168308058 /NCGR_PEP_ID=MMETSP0142_2-20121227/60146_1 /TAXON_ID=44445 /ORGANISM="Pseudo-nitzschia australis, Strain 10249 10 AB" /LENGTH=272 /DNA_ID=CAMNT_0008260317 /DNA_START=111 /DNA_END=929 /DNA_ORIENTATION=+
MLPLDFSPEPKDILCGRGNVFSNHEGNQYFARIIHASLRDYVAAPNRPKKIRVVGDILKQILFSGARFAKVDSETKRWYQLNNVEAHQKIGHAIRDTIRFLGKEKKKNDGAKSTATKEFLRVTKPSSAIVKRKILERRQQARNNAMLCQSLSSQFAPMSLLNHKRKASETRISSIEGILRLDAADCLNAILGNDISCIQKQQQQHKSPISVIITPPTTPISPTTASYSTGAIKPEPSYFLENEYPENDFDFSANSFFGDYFGGSPDSIINNR